MITTRIVGLDKARAKIRAVGPTAMKPAREILGREARGVAVSLAKSTQPYGTGEQARTMGRNRVAADIYKVYTTPAKAFADFGDRNLAKAFWSHLQHGRADQATKLLERHGRALRSVHFARFDGGVAHITSRDLRTGRVRAKTPLAIVRNPRQLAAYIKRRQENVGFGKSGWADVARRFGGTRGLRESGDITANWITRRLGRGSVTWMGSADNPIIRITSHVRYGDRILPERDRRIAILIARERLVKALQTEARYELRQLRAAA